MKWNLFLLLLLSGAVYGQSKYYIRADTLVVEKVGGNANLNLLNSTRGKQGAYLRNVSGGRTDFYYAVDSASISGSNLTLWRGGGTQNIVIGIPGGGGTTDVKIGSPLILDGSDISVLPPFRSQLSYNDQSSYIMNRVFQLKTSDCMFDHTDGGVPAVRGDTLFWQAGWDGFTTTDEIRYSVDKGVTWSLYSKTTPYAFANIAWIPARYPGDYNYFFGHTTDATKMGYVVRYKNVGEYEIMTTSAAYAPRCLYAVTRDDNGGLYVWFGQGDNTDTTTLKDDAWYSSPQSGGASWTQIQTGVTGFGGCLINQGQFINGHHVIVNAGNKMGNGHVYSAMTMILSVDNSTDKTKWRRVQDSPGDPTLFSATAIDKGVLWRYGGANSAPTNLNSVTYLDQSWQWHTYYNFYGLDPTDEIKGSHAAALLPVGGSLYFLLGNNSQEVAALSDSSISTPGWFRRYVKVHENTYISNLLSDNAGMIGSGVTASETENSKIVRVANENYTPYYQPLFDGHYWGGLTSSQTLGTGYPKTTGRQMSLNPSGQVEIGTSSSSFIDLLIVWNRISAWGNDNAASFQWGKNPGTGAVGKLTYGTNQAIISGEAGCTVAIAAKNGGNTVVVDDGGVGIAASTAVAPVASAVLELTSTSKGFLPPRMTGAQAEAISSPAEGLLIYSTDGSGSTITSKGWWGWSGAAWEKLN